MTTMTRRQISSTDTERAAADGFVFGYPLVLMARMRGASPLNAFEHERPGPQPADTLASSAWLELGDEPVVLSVPGCHGQYYVLSLIDMWTNVFASIGPRTTGADAGSYAVGGPRWNGGALPPGILGITAPTGSVRIAGQTQLDRGSGGRAARSLQDGIRLHWLSNWGPPSPGRPPNAVAPTLSLSPEEQLEGMDARTFFAELATLLQGNPPRRADREFVEGLRRAGVLPGAGEPEIRDAELDGLRERGLRAGLARVRSAAQSPREQPAGQWRVRYRAGPYGTDYLRRAAAACSGMFGASAGDEVPAVVTEDLDGEPLSGERRYLLRFEADQPPPVRGFWSLASYADGSPAAGRRCRSLIGDADGLTVGIDGSLSIHIQSERPPGREQRANWLATPAGTFRLVLRLFWPVGDVLQRRWSPPAVTRVG